MDYVGLTLKDIPESRVENAKSLVRHCNASILSEERKGNYINLVIAAKGYRAEEIKKRALLNGYASKVYCLDDSETDHDYVMSD